MPPEPALKDRARRSVPFTALAGLVQLVVSLLGMLLLVRTLRPEQYGAWMILLGFATPLSLIASLGHLQSLMRYVPALETESARRAQVWRTTLQRGAAAAAAFAALLAVFPWLADRFDVAGQWSVLAALAPGFVALAANDYLVAGLHLGFRQREALLGLLAQQLIFVAGVAAGIALHAELLFFAAVFSLSAAAQVALDAWYCARHYGPPSLAELRGGAAEDRAHRRFRLISYLDELGTMVVSSPVNRLVLATLATTGEVALFAVATNIVDRLTALQPLHIFRPLATVSFFSRYEESRSVAEVGRMFRFIYGVNRAVCMLFLVLLVPLGHELLVVFFRDEYADAYLPMIVLCFAMAVFTMPVGMVAQALERPQALVWAKLSVLLNVGLGIPLALRFGALGMAIGAAAGLLAKNVITLLVIRLEFDVRYPWGTLGRSLAAGAVSAAAIEWAQYGVPWYAAAALGVVVYAAALRVFSVLDASERALLVSLLPLRIQGAARSVIG